MIRAACIMAGFLSNALLGNVCLIQVGHAAEPHVPVVRMSMADPIKCPWVEAQTDVVEKAAQSPCATGHCFKQSEPEIADCALATSVTHASSLVLPTSVAALPTPPHTHALTPRSHSPPPPPLTATIVLRI